ncbi:hypothetical protein ACIRU8_45770 [Streptomyces sp. NPDC101175]|uniref:DUF7739 domain-containing protein n=1 Tax=Streptomyces sp. NPDC101175 TaxID=3366123 RepID=UPI0038393B1C
MTRKPQINDPEAHVITSHGADFFGEDRHALKTLASLAEYAEGCLPRAERGPLVQLLAHPGETASIPPATAADFAELLLRVARQRFVKASTAAHARMLGDSAARAAADGEPWTWHLAS